MNSKEIKVYGFKAKSAEAAASKLNDWLATNDVDVIDIKFQSASLDKSSVIWLDVLVIYKENKSI